ncbi:MAG: amino acid adenylation domain-containing protein [Pseudomonadota bacterium]
MLAEKLAKLSPEQRELLLKRLQQQKGAEAHATDGKLPEATPDPANLHQPFPLTDVQEAYWIGRQGSFELGNVSAHGYTEIDGWNIDLARLKQAWQGTIARHPMLRAIVEWNGKQKILESVPEFEIPLLDLRHLSAEDAEREALRVRDEMSHRVIPSDRWPLYEMAATLFPDGRTRLHIGLDVLIFDAWSYDILNWELEQRYLNPEVDLPALDFSFRDYVLGLESLKGNAEWNEAKAYWMERIKDFPPPPELPLARDPKSIGVPRFIRHASRLPAADWAAFKARAAKAGVTPSVALLTAYTDVLATWSKNETFTVNLTLFNRLPLHEQVNDIMGDFTNLVMVAIDAPKDADFMARARHIQKQLWLDMDHRLFGGVQLVRELARHWGKANESVMPVVFTSAVGHAMPESKGAHFTWLGKEVFTITQTPQVWLDHQVFEDGDELVFDWDAVEGLFPEGMLEIMFEGFRRQLVDLATGDEAWREIRRDYLPESMLAYRPALGPEVDIGQHRLLHTPFIEQALAHPERTALIAAGRHFSYGEIYRRSRHIAQALRDHGLQPGELVAVVSPKDWIQTVAVMAILQAGGAYLPVDPALPEDRRNYIFDKARARFALTKAPLIDALEWPQGVTALAVDGGEFEGIDAEPIQPLRAVEDLAYVIFTSGSTGQPKGVMIDHRGALNTIQDINRRFALGPEDRVFAISALSFDLSVYDIFGALAAGAAIVLPEVDGLRDPSYWARMTAEHKVSLWNSVPALMEMLVTYLEGQHDHLPDSLRVVMMSGDWIPVTLPNRIKAIARPDIRVNSLGGATEGSIWSIIYPIEQVDPAWTSIPYGKGMTNQAIQVLDRSLRQRPDWVAGDLYISGIGVAKGYLGDEERTNAAFFTHPKTGEALYRTGDLGRYLPDGNIEFLGREDFQVKIQGYRIELGEIETVLAKHPAVHGAVVNPHGNERGNRRLIAYIVPRHEDSVRPLDGFPLLTDGAERFQFRMSQIALRRFDPLNSGIIELPALTPEQMRQLDARRTDRRFRDETLSFSAFADLLAWLASKPRGNSLPKFSYGSAGNLYPVRAYVYVAEGRVENIPSGIYYYNPAERRLYPVNMDARISDRAHAPANRPGFNESAFSIFLVGKIGAIAPLYGQYSRHFCTIEVGLMSQALEAAAPAHGLGLCQIGVMDFESIAPMFHLEEDEVYLHSLYGGIPAQDDDGITPDYRDDDEEDEAPMDSLREYLKAHLPDYMVPSTYITMDTLPLTSNGKVDRKALPTPEEHESKHSHQEFVAPRGDLEEVIAGIWREVLGREQVSIHDNFFDIGGNSVHMVQIHSRLQDIVQKPVALVDMFFRYPTIANLVDFLDEGKDSADDGSHHEMTEEERGKRLDHRRKSMQDQRRARLAKRQQ